MTSSLQARSAATLAHGLGLAILLTDMAEAKQSNPMGVAIAMAVLALVGLGLIGYGFWLTSKAKRVAGWPRASGRIMTSHVDEQRRRKGATVHHFRVRYTYEAAGQSYEGTNFRVGIDGIRRGEVEPLQVAYKAGTPIQAYYNPDDPKDAVLEIGRTRSWLFHLVGAVLIVMGVGFAFLILSTAPR